MAILSVNLLGSVVVDFGGQRVNGFRSVKTLSLLAYAVCERRIVSREYLATMLWPDTPPAEARGHLRRALHDLMHKLPGAILSDYHTIQFNPQYVAETDIARFESLRAKRDPASLQAAAALCSGELLEGITLEACPVFDQWLAAERELWRARAVEVLETLLGLQIQMLAYDRAIEVAWQILKLEPSREDIHRQLMLLLTRTGHPGMAIKQYKRCCRNLADELDMEPSETTTTLYKRIRQIMAHPPRPFPHQTTPFLGRQESLAALLQHALDPGSRLITIVGPSGIGKSRLAVEAGAQIDSRRERSFLDGVCLVALGAARTPQELTVALARALEHHSGRLIRGHHYRRYLRDHELLLILDSFSHLLPHKGYLRDLLAESPALKLIVTAPEPLRLPGERVLAIDA